MNYAIRKVYTNNDGYHTVLPTTTGDVYTFDSSAVYDDNTEFFFSEVQGILVMTVNGRVDLFDGNTFVIVSYEDSDVVPYPMDTSATFVSSCKVVLSGNSFDTTTLATYFDFTQLTSISAYFWATYLKNYDQVIDYVTDQGIMSNWVKYVRASDHDRFAPSIVDEEWMYYWATELDDSTFFVKLTSQNYLFSYAQYFPDRTALVKGKITDPQWVEIWNNTYPDDQIVDVTSTPPPEVTPLPTPDIPEVVINPSEDVI